jgi:uroporphyrin-III C-methyltransferase
MTRNLNGKVYLAGAGPGDPELLTVKVLKLLRRANLILHDDLVPASILSLAGPQAEIASVGKRCGAKKITQEEINARMIEAARRGATVLRLKNGDPAIFGRLAEEIDALEAAGVPFEVVPGVTAGTAAAASLGVSLTDRRTSSRVVIVSGHRAQEADAAEIDWTTLVRDDATLAIYMPCHDFTSLRDELLAAGLAAHTPAVVVSRASRPRQQHLRATLGQIASLPPLESPSILLIGRTLARVQQAEDAEELSHAIEEAAAIFAPRS